VDEMQKSLFVLKLQSDASQGDHLQLNYTVDKEKVAIQDLADLTRYYPFKIVSIHQGAITKYVR
jgi:hypothetical protein